MIKFDRILCPTDFSENAGRALQYANGIAGEFKSELHLLHVLPDITAAMSIYGDLVFVMPDEWIPTMEKHSNDLLTAIPVDNPEISRTVRVTVQGETSVEIINYAGEQRIDLIVMGTQGKSNLTHILMGDTTDKVLQKAHCPVMTVPSRERQG